MRPATKFMQEFYQYAVADSVAPDTWLMDGCMVRMRQLSHNRVILISLYSPERGAGNGGRALRRICAWADRFCIDIVLSCEPTPQTDGGLKYWKLWAWYRKYGFESDMDRSKEMTRWRSQKWN